MRTHLSRFTALLAIGSAAACLSITPASAQITRRPTAPRTQVAPPAPFPPESPAPLAEVDELQRAAVSALDDVHIADLGNMADRIDANVAPMLAMTDARLMDLDFGRTPLAHFWLQESPRAPWAQGDPADSLYRLARESLNSGEYRRAAQMFAQISRQYPTSQYRSDAAYWRAFSLYRIGGIADLHEALQALDSAATVNHKAATDGYNSSSKSYNSSSNGYGSSKVSPVIWNSDDKSNAVAYYMDSRRSLDADAAVLATRIRGALAARGDATAAAQLARTADAGGPACDEEDAQLRVEALNALVQMDPKNADPAITKVLARRDSCAAPLRRGALALLARTNDSHSIDLLISSARTDPSIEVRAEAIQLLGRSSDDRATTALTEIATSSDKPPLQRIAVRSLAAQQSPASSQAIRNLVNRTDVSSDVRITALHYAGKNDLQVGDLVKMYDASSDRATREEIISLLEQRQEPQAADKLIDIARTSTDPAMRRLAISALSRKKDPRTTKLLMDILDK